MYTKQDLVNKLINEDSSINFELIYCSLASWNIKPTYVDENNIEHFDENAMKKLNEAIQLKKQGKSDCEINSMLNNCEKSTIDSLAELVVSKISNEILEPMKNSAKLHRDNELLAQHVEKLLDENKKLNLKIDALEKNNLKFKQIYGPIYVKHL